MAQTESHLSLTTEIKQAMEIKCNVQVPCNITFAKTPTGWNLEPKCLASSHLQQHPLVGTKRLAISILQQHPTTRHLTTSHLQQYPVMDRSAMQHPFTEPSACNNYIYNVQ
jgi:hypothetical protein